MAIRILPGDCRTVMRGLPDESVHCVVTSPPYWRLRDYGVAGQLGLEPTIGEYVETMVAVFREVRRVLRKDGTLWLNLGDSYTSGIKGTGGDGSSSGLMRDGRKETGRASKFDAVERQHHRPIKIDCGSLKPKDLCGIPWRLAFALQADGWYLRQDIIWAKPNPMPDSVTDRCTKAHEYLFLLSKSANYFYDAEAVKEKSVGDVSRPSFRGGCYVNNDGGSKSVDVGNVHSLATTRNRRSVWNIATAPFPEAHFATFPPALVEPCIKAGTSERGCCAKCGAPWVREIEKTRTFESGSGRAGNMPIGKNGPNLQGGGATLDIRRGPCVNAKTIGWSPSCSCTARALTFPCTVLDPFGGAGTTGLVADRLGRDAVLIELSPEYAAMAERRLKKDAGLFAQVAAE